MINCQQGIVLNAIVPSITYCHLNLKNNYDNSRNNLGYYYNGFWVQDTASQFPFLRQSYMGEYKSPTLNGK